jgi:4-amino-4-deoxy-L-arabinose transferase-like glycosyltransferase
MKATNILKNPFLLFLPFLAVSILFVLLFQTGDITGDEKRYITDAMNLLHGFFSPPPPEIRLFNGPGYPILLMPFEWLHLPVTAIQLLNPFFLYLSLVFLYKSLVNFVSPGKSLLCCFLFFIGCYLNLSMYLHMAIPEVLTVLFITLLLFLLIKAFDESGRRKHQILAGIVLGYLCLTKVVFGYVLACMLAGVLVIWLFKRQSVYNRRMLAVLLVASITVTPYLAYTYKITGRFFYWSSLGGNNMYWMSTLHKDEYGSWFRQPQIQNGILVPGMIDTDKKIKSSHIQGHMDSVIKHNKADLLAIIPNEKDILALDDAYKNAAIKNIRQNPRKFLINCISNAGRMVFNFPYTYSLQKPGMLARLPLNGTLVLLFIFCLFPAIRNWKKIPLSIRFMLFISAIYFGGSLLGSAEIRMFNPLVPTLLIFISFVLGKAIKLQPLKWENKSV